MSLFHTSTPSEWHLHYKQMHPRRGLLLQLYFRTLNPSCLHLGPWPVAEKNYQNLESGMLSNNLGYGEIPLFFSMEKHFIAWDWSEASCLHLQETHGRYFTQDTKIGCEKLSIPAVALNVLITRRGKDIPLADALSRVSPTPVEEGGIQLPIITVNLITSSVPVSTSEIEMIREETARDTTHQSSETLHTCGMASWQKNAATRTSHFLELQRRSLHGKRTHYKRGPDSWYPPH